MKKQDVVLWVVLVVAVLAFVVGSLHCTIQVDVSKPQVHIDCVEIVLPGGAVTTECFDAGAPDGS